jgi:hypothetical protein
VITCYDNAGQYYLDAGAGYSSYKWSTGDTTQVITLNAVGNYGVYVPTGTAGYLRSETFVVNSMNDPCGILSVEEIDDIPIKIAPSITSSEISIILPTNLKAGTPIEIYNIDGRLLQTMFAGVESAIVFNVSHFSSGIYAIRCGNSWCRFVKN